MILGMLDFVQT